SKERDEVREAERAASTGLEHASSQQDRQAAEQARQRHRAVGSAVGFEQVGHLTMAARHLAKLQQVDTRDEPDAIRRLRERDRLADHDFAVMDQRALSDADSP